MFSSIRRFIGPLTMGYRVAYLSNVPRHLCGFRMKTSATLLNTRFGSVSAQNKEQPVNSYKPSAQQVLLSKIEEQRPFSQSEWDSLRKECTSMGDVRLNESSFDAVAMMGCTLVKALATAKSLLKFIEQSGRKPNLATLSRFMHLCHLCPDDNAEEMLLKGYQQIKESYPLVDVGSAANIILGLCRTKLWRDSLEYLEIIKETSQPNPVVSSTLAAAAFQHNDYTLGWSLADEMLANDHHISDVFYLAWLGECEKVKKMETDSKSQLVLQSAQQSSSGEVPGPSSKLMILKLLEFLSTNEVLPGRSAVDKIKRYFERSLNTRWYGFYTRSTKHGSCMSCGMKLERLELSRSDFTKLSDAILPRLVQGTDVYHNTTPKEMDNFQRFVDTTIPYDIVLDGLNVAYSAQHSYNKNLSKSFLLYNVVKNYVEQGKRVCVIGRRHILDWNKNHVDYIKKHSRVFLADNLTRDDPFLLYAVMRSGPNTKYVSRDLMKNHLFNLGDSELRSIFRKWQNRSQLWLKYVDKTGKVIIGDAKQHASVTQYANGTWHIPYIEEPISDEPLIPTEFCQDTASWLCLSSNELNALNEPSQTRNRDRSVKPIATENNYSHQRTLNSRVKVPRNVITDAFQS